MTNPALNVAIAGQGVVTADNLNSYLQGGGVFLANLRGFSALTNMLVYMSGYTSNNDGGQGMFTWVLGTGTDDAGVTTIVPTGNTAGYWSRIGNGSTVRTPQTVTNAAGVTLTAANVANEILLRTGAAGVTDTFPTASAILGAVNTPYGAQAGSTRSLLVVNENSGTLNLAPGSGVTFAGNLSTGNFAIPTVSQRMFVIYIASASTVTVYG
jgi:hypothetical protein